MFSIQPGCGLESDEKLAAICIRTRVCHTHDTCPSMLKILCYFIFELSTVKALAPVIHDPSQERSTYYEIDEISVKKIVKLVHSTLAQSQLDPPDNEKKFGTLSN